MIFETPHLEGVFFYFYSKTKIPHAETYGIII
jgi:hypothetical protein